MSSSLRVGDAERDLAAGWLGTHYAAGRLTRVEYDERLAAALSARTRADLDLLFADLPLLDEQRPVPSRFPKWQQMVRLRPGLIAAALAAAALLGPIHTWSGPAGAIRSPHYPRHDTSVLHLLPLLLVVAVAFAISRRVLARHRRAR